MKKNIWIMNHYATSMFLEQAGRHYWFSKNLLEQGYKPTIFCASTVHNSDYQFDTGLKKSSTRYLHRIPFVFVKAPIYRGNGKKRIWNILAYTRNMSAVAQKHAEQNGKPDIILASSVHPLTLIAGLNLAKKFGIPCICEVRDLWPESLIAYGSLKKNSLFSSGLYMGEKWIYQKADKLIFTMEGGKDYIRDRGWHTGGRTAINLTKIHHINNGIDIEAFDQNKENNVFSDEDLENENMFKVVYAGSIRKVNNVGKLVEIAQLFADNGVNDISFLIFGTGPDKEKLEKYCAEQQLTNVKFKGRVDRNKIPYILSNSDLNFIHFQQNSVKKYGASLNKMFEYFASGKPTLSDCEFGYDLINKYNAGMVLDSADVKVLSEGIMAFKKMPAEKYAVYAANARAAAVDYDFKKLTLDLIDIIEN